MANVACAGSTLAGRFPQARVEPVCARSLGIHDDAEHWVYTKDGQAISNIEEADFDRLASEPEAVIFTFDVEAPRTSVLLLRYPDNQGECRTGFSWLPSRPLDEPSPAGCRGACQLPSEEVVSLGPGPLRARAGEGYSSGQGRPRGPWIAQQAGGTSAAASRGAQIWGGFAAGVAIGSVPGGSVGAQLATDSGQLAKGSRDARVGKAAGEMAAGGAHAILGAAGAGGGVAVSATGVGAPAGVPAAVASAAMVVHGVTTLTMGMAHMVDAVRSPNDAVAAPSTSTSGAASAGTNAGAAAKRGASGTNGATSSGARAGAPAAGARTTTVVKTKTTTRTKQNPNGKHGNSADGDGPQHGYEIADTRTGKVVKTGVSGGKRRPDGGSVRADKQADKWSRDVKEPDRFQPKVVEEVPAAPGARKQILQWERDNARRLRDTQQLQEPKKHQKP